MEFQHETIVPLLDNIEQDMGDVSYTLDNLSCVTYVRQGKTYVKIVQSNDNIIPNEFKYVDNKSKKRYINYEYLQILLIQNIKLLKEDNERLRDDVRLLKDKIDKIDN